MSQRRQFHCPACKASVVGELLENGSIRCDYRLNGWKSIPTGINGKGETEYEHVPNSSPGCGGTMGLCIHGLRVCEGLPPCDNFKPAAEPPALVESLADVMRREAAEVARRRERHQSPSHHGSPSQEVSRRPKEEPPPQKLHIPFLGDSEPARYTPPRGGRRKRT